MLLFFYYLKLLMKVIDNRQHFETGLNNKGLVPFDVKIRILLS